MHLILLGDACLAIFLFSIVAITKASTVAYAYFEIWYILVQIQVSRKGNLEKRVRCARLAFYFFYSCTVI